MSRKKRANKRQQSHQARRPTRHRAKAIVIVALMLCTGLTSVILA